MKLLTLKARRIKETTGYWKGFYRTELLNSKGKIVATYPAEAKQPHRNKKTIIHNCFKYNLKWV